MLFSIVFILSFLNYFIIPFHNNGFLNNHELAAIIVLLFWGSVILIEPIDENLIKPIWNVFVKKTSGHVIGTIYSRQGSSSVIVQELVSGSNLLNIGDLILLKEHNDLRRVDQQCLGLISDISISDKTRYFEITTLNDMKESIEKIFYAYKITEKEAVNISSRHQTDKRFIDRKNFLGVVIDGSDIDVLKVKMREGIDYERILNEGDLIETSIYGNSVKYQIINSKTDSFIIEGKSRQGAKVITAQQIGIWDNDKQQFQDASWVPDNREWAFLESTSTEPYQSKGNGYYKVGVIPKSNYPIYINFDEAISHHIAIIGKTGTGKSYMAARMLEQMAKYGYKIVILEVDQNNPQSLSRYISNEYLSASVSKWSSETKTRRNSRGNQESYNEWKCDIDLNSDGQKRIFRINWENDIKSTDSGPTTMTDGAIAIIQTVIKYSIANKSEKMCIVMEEAYDFIPESTFGSQEYGQPNVSRVSQLVLKCRKHNIGFMIITQRTALVTKTILYQCHTIIALQSFDETSKHFMSAYIDSEYLDSLSILPRFRAIVVGKGSTCDKPVIVDFFDKNAAEELKVLSIDQKPDVVSKKLIISPPLPPKSGSKP